MQDDCHSESPRHDLRLASAHRCPLTRTWMFYRRSRNGNRRIQPDKLIVDEGPRVSSIFRECSYVEGYECSVKD